MFSENISTQYLPRLEHISNIYAISTEGGGHAAPDVLSDVQNVGGGGHGVLAALLLHLRRTYHLSDTRGVNEA